MPFVQANFGPRLGQADDDLSAYADESTVTGLPVYAEAILGVVAVFALSRLVSAGKSVGKRVKTGSRKRARRQALKAELAAL
jgi:hypothetical protein